MTRELELASSEFPSTARDSYVFHLFVTGMTPRSLEAISRIKSICETHLDGRYELTVIDIYQQPHLASGEQIVATPTLIRKRPSPLRRFIGNLTSWEGLLLHQDLQGRTT